MLDHIGLHQVALVGQGVHRVDHLDGSQVDALAETVGAQVGDVPVGQARMLVLETAIEFVCQVDAGHLAQAEVEQVVVERVGPDVLHRDFRHDRVERQGQGFGGRDPARGAVIAVAERHSFADPVHPVVEKDIVRPHRLRIEGGGHGQHLEGGSRFVDGRHGQVGEVGGTVVQGLRVAGFEIRQVGHGQDGARPGVHHNHRAALADFVSVDGIPQFLFHNVLQGTIDCEHQVAPHVGRDVAPGIGGNDRDRFRAAGQVDFASQEFLIVAFDAVGAYPIGVDQAQDMTGQGPLRIVPVGLQLQLEMPEEVEVRVRAVEGAAQAQTVHHLLEARSAVRQAGIQGTRILEQGLQAPQGAIVAREVEVPQVGGVGAALLQGAQVLAGGQRQVVDQQHPGVHGLRFAVRVARGVDFGLAARGEFVQFQVEARVQFVPPGPVGSGHQVGYNIPIGRRHGPQAGNHEAERPDVAGQQTAVDVRDHAPRVELGQVAIRVAVDVLRVVQDQLELHQAQDHQDCQQRRHGKHQDDAQVVAGKEIVAERGLRSRIRGGHGVTCRLSAARAGCRTGDPAKPGPCWRDRGPPPRLRLPAAGM